ncbi:MAG: hypothetical protein E3J90_03035 [Promethearchaeota archaeon]|nr:MAG: hypothetical protein E3J90_03035 [Candidatus Lokiarchaeota archaeon]
MKEKKLTLYAMAKFVTREVILLEQIHYSDAFQTRLLENYKKSQKFLRNKIITTKISSAIIFGVLPIIPLLTYLKIIQYLSNPSISIEIMMFGGSLIFSIFFLVQFFNFFLLAMINTTMIMSGESFEWYESLPISRERLKKLVLFTIFRSLDLPIIVILMAFPIIMFIGTLDVVLLLICSGVSILNFIFSFFILLIFTERVNRIMDINEINSKKGIFIRLLNMFSYIFIVVGSVYFIQWISNSLDTFFNLFLNYEYPVLINLILTIIPFPLNSGYIVSLFIKPNQVPFQLWLNSFLGLLIFIILIWLIYKKSLEWLDPAIFSKYKPIKKSILSDSNNILVKIKTTSPIIAYLRKDLVIISRDLKAFTSLIMPIFISFVFTFSYSFINIGGIAFLDRDFIFNWLFLVGFNLITSGIIVNGMLNIEDANDTIRASLPIISRDQAKAKLIVIFLIQTLSVISPILLFITNPAFIDVLITFLGTLPFSWLFLFIMFEMRIIFFSRMRNHYVTEETFPENKTIKWIIIYIIVYLLFICIFYALVYVYFTEGIMNAITFSIIVFSIGFVSTILIFDNLFPNIRNVKIKIKSFIWILPLICGLITLRAIFAPAAYYFGRNKFPLLIFWMWGWYYRKGIWEWGTAERFISDPLILNIGIICTVLIIVGASIFIVNSISAAFIFRKGNRFTKIVLWVWFLCGILLIIAPIFWMAMVQIFPPFSPIPVGSDPPLNFWSVFFPAWAVIAPIITGALSCGTIILFKIIFGKSYKKANRKI